MPTGSGPDKGSPILCEWGCGRRVKWRYFHRDRVVWTCGVWLCDECATELYRRNHSPYGGHHSHLQRGVYCDRWYWYGGGKTHGLNPSISLEEPVSTAVEPDRYQEVKQYYASWSGEDVRAVASLRGLTVGGLTDEEILQQVIKFDIEF